MDDNVARAARGGAWRRRAYIAESDFFEADWARAYWGANYPRLLAAKDRYDPDGLFVVHHGVGSPGAPTASPVWRDGSFDVPAG